MRTAAINLCVLPTQRDLIDHAAVLFQLNQQSFEEFIQLLEQPVQDNLKLNQLLDMPNPWDKP